MPGENNYLHGKNIVIIGITPFDWGLANNCKDMALELAKNNRVLYVNIPLKRSEILRKKKSANVEKRVDLLKQKRNELVRVEENLWNLYPGIVSEPINQVKPKFIFDLLNRINNKRYAKSIRKALNELGFNEFILFNDNDIYTGFYLKELLRPVLYIYYIRDMLTTMSYWKMHSVRLEPRLIAKADLVVANSVYIANYAKQFNEHSYYIGQGCDVDHFKSALTSIEIPSDLKKIPKPRIGYIGAITSERLDIQLIVNVARKRQSWSFVLIGPSDAAFRSSELTKCRNVYFFDQKPFIDLPNYLKGIDVCINPQRLNQLTIGNYPRKIDEYLAAGKPIVATFTEAMTPFENYTYLVRTEEEYVEGIEKALKDSDTEQLQISRSQFASAHTWANCLKELDLAIQAVLK